MLNKGEILIFNTKKSIIITLATLTIFLIIGLGNRLTTVFATNQPQTYMVNQQLVSELTHAKQIITDYDNQQVEQQKETFKANVLAEQQRQAQVKEQERLEAEKQAQLQEQQRQQEVAAQTQAPAAVSQAAEQTSNQGTFKLSFYDPAVLGSNMGYSGVAANLSVFPKGTKLKITLSDGTVWYRTVNDTGTFAYSNPRQLDVAMPNNQIPSAGILYATVEIVS
ncbi:hypothetical protein FC86_GL000022 [Holzapfeliella floricola DSM 23037 = JCM 16512]|uniref:Hydrolase n=2 Tax=Holzapfeliella TaxID=2767883 RepID=A0A0R2DKG6_9LACO|nr:hypothetical protein FC86_GL000022 [Holzapfeliella floricola DSM 23037 = JCM 16512]